MTTGGGEAEPVTHTTDTNFCKASFRCDECLPAEVPDAASSTRAQRSWMSKADRRFVRQQVSLAKELSLHSVEVRGVVYTIRHDRAPQPNAGSNPVVDSAVTFWVARALNPSSALKRDLAPLAFEI